MKLINLTPHNIVLRADEGDETVVPTIGQVARVSSTPGPLVHAPQDALPVPVYGPDRPGEIVGLPDSQPETLYIVSNVVADQITNRGDVVCPATGPLDGAIRNEEGQIVAVSRLKLGRQAS